MMISSTFFLENGIPRELCKNIQVKDNGKIYVNSLENSLCQTVIKNINLKKYGDKTLYCSGIVPVNPNKVNQVVTNGGSVTATPLEVPASEDSRDSGMVPSTPPSAGGSGGTNSTILQPPPVPSQLVRRKSVKDLVTDFSSCLSSVSSGEEEPPGAWGETVTKRKKKKRKASMSPLLDNNLQNQNVRDAKKAAPK